MNKRLGLDLRVCGQTHSCDVGPRDWGILTSSSRFSNLSQIFRGHFGVDALSSEITLSNPTATVIRKCSHFLTQVKAAKRSYLEEAEELKYNYQVCVKGQPLNSRNASCEYLGRSAFAIGSSGFCYLELSNGSVGLDSRVLGIMDVRPYKQFEVDNGKALKIMRRKARESQIDSALTGAINFLSEFDHFERVEIDLFG